MSDDDNSKKSGGGCFKYFFLLCVFLIIAAVVAFGGFLWLSGKSLDNAKETVMEMFETYRPKKTYESFLEYRDLQVQGNDGNILEVATGEQIIELTREDSVQVLGKVLPVKTTSRINVPATFRYHIDLKGDWKLIEDEDRLHVVAPPLKPSLPVAFDSSKMQKNNPGWFNYITGDSMIELEKTITPELEKKAKDPEQAKLFEDKAKLSIAKFLQTWLMGEGQWAEGKYEQIIVYFDEADVDTSDKLTRPNAELRQPAL